jgi:hypothetical protein
MKITFDLWSADEIIQSYIDFVKNKNSKEIYINYSSEKYGFKETMQGKLDIDDQRLKNLPKKIQYSETAHQLELFQKNWRIEFKLRLIIDSENDNRESVELIYDDSLKKEVYNHFKEFAPKVNSD